MDKTQGLLEYVSPEIEVIYLENMDIVVKSCVAPADLEDPLCTPHNE